MHSLSYFQSEVIYLNINHESKYRTRDTSFKDVYTRLSALIPSCKRPRPCSTRRSLVSTRVPSKKKDSMNCFTFYYFYRRAASVRDPEAVLGRTQLDGLSNKHSIFESDKEKAKLVFWGKMLENNLPGLPGSAKASQSCKFRTPFANVVFLQCKF